jgi:predicted methyltransferase
MIGWNCGVRARASVCTLACIVLFALAWAAAVAQSAPDYAAIVAAPDGSDADREIDKRRDPVKLLAFTGVRAGMKVLDMGAGGGYSSELMARAVAAGGVVYAQNAADLGARAKERFDARMKTSAMTKVVALTRPFDDPLPAEVRDLDLITFFFFYHDTTYMEVDRAEMNRKLYAALKPGGTLVIADHSARPGDGATVGKTFHRIEEGVLRREVEAAGFTLRRVISCATPRTRATSRSIVRPGRWTSSCSSLRSRTDARSALVVGRVGVGTPRSAPLPAR